MSTCSEVDSDIHALIKELVIRPMGAQLGDTLQGVSECGEGRGKSASPAAVFVVRLTAVYRDSAGVITSGEERGWRLAAPVERHDTKGHAGRWDLKKK